MLCFKYSIRYLRSIRNILYTFVLQIQIFRTYNKIILLSFNFYGTLTLELDAFLMNEFF
jgi:hypothetical protein